MTLSEDIAKDFEFCDIRWDGVGGSRALSENQVVEGHVCAEHRPGHTIHICCCGAVKRDE